MKTRTTETYESTESELTPLQQVPILDMVKLRGMLLNWLAQHISDEADLKIRTLPAVQKAIEEISDDELESLQQAYLVCGQGIRFFPMAPTGRRIGHAFLSEMATNLEVDGMESLQAALDQGPVLVVSNHLSYADSQITEYLMTKLGHEDMAKRLTFVAGPKVYDDSFRRMGAVSLNTIPTAQSTRLSHNNINRSKREVALIALKTIRLTFGLMQKSYPVWLYAEGARTRTGRLGSFLRATCRYAQVDGLRLIPAALDGSQAAFPIHEHQLKPAAISLKFGDSIVVQPKGAQEAMEAAWQALVDLLPEERRPASDTAPLI